MSAIQTFIATAIVIAAMAFSHASRGNAEASSLESDTSPEVFLASK